MEIGTGRPATQLFLGEVTGIEMTLDRGQPEFTVIADDLAYKMHAGHEGQNVHQGQLRRRDSADRR